MYLYSNGYLAIEKGCVWGGEGVFGGAVWWAWGVLVGVGVWCGGGFLFCVGSWWP